MDVIPMNIPIIWIVIGFVVILALRYREELPIEALVYLGIGIAGFAVGQSLGTVPVLPI
mgnify:CR=1 FL=1